MAGGFVLIPDACIDELSGWAGDLQSIMKDVVENNMYRNDAVKVHNVAMQYVISKGDFSRFPKSDLFTDYDAVNLYYMLYYGNSKYKTITGRIREYYSKGYLQRISLFLHNVYLASEDNMYDCLYKDAIPYTVLEFVNTKHIKVKWPLYNATATAVTNITPIESEVVAKVYSEKVMELYYKEKE